VRAVATQTLREAKNREAFLKKGCEILGFPIEVIAGTEEARLIYQGVAHLLPSSNERRLVIDIGGRSTELVLGQGLDATETASFRVGSVAWSMKYFPSGEFTQHAFDKAEIAAQAVLEEALSTYPREHGKKRMAPRAPWAQWLTSWPCLVSLRAKSASMVWTGW